MFALANAYNGRAQDTYFEIPHFKLQKIVNKLYATLTDHYFHLCAKLQNYENCEIKPVERVFRSSPISKWRDVYVHLDITSHRIQLAYKEIFNILELLDANSDDKDEDNLIELITAKMNEAYKQLENARCSAEFSSLLIVKTQKKAVTTPETENENLFSVSQDKRTVVMVNDMPVIEDEVFEEYIREAYLKPLMEGGNGIIDEYRLDKLLKKNFMSELKEALVDKQKSMMERELRALTRMYEKMKRDHCIEQPNVAIESASELDVKPPVSAPLAPPQLPTVSELDLKPLMPTSPPAPQQPPTVSEPDLEPSVPTPPPAPHQPSTVSESDLGPSVPTPPPFLQQPPSIPNNRAIVEVEEPEENVKTCKKTRGPVPLPRVKMWQSNDPMPYVQKFSISECTPNFKFPPFRAEEETFLGSGENSEEEEEENDKNINSSDSEEVEN
ncbi:histone-lysine N-methyltransferase SETD1B-like [Copidosoma floridanum]|uniref:histone-lysine N-methyltransferase SETD1B-like n=1 Tax=Copidosoma floridanum TaxID=29053 RepID=UPI000C6FADF4|nr:histone-lysine N-methyltransferase SETD1B-like [Copidosoma floridanum]